MYKHLYQDDQILITFMEKEKKIMVEFSTNGIRPRFVSLYFSEEELNNFIDRLCEGREELKKLKD